MTTAEVAAFESTPYAYDAVQVRRWDDRAKDPELGPIAFETFRPLLESLVRPA